MDDFFSSFDFCKFDGWDFDFEFAAYFAHTIPILLSISEKVRFICFCFLVTAVGSSVSPSLLSIWQVVCGAWLLLPLTSPDHQCHCRISIVSRGLLFCVSDLHSNSVATGHPCWFFLVWLVLNSEVPFDIAYNLMKDAELALKLKDVYCDDIKCLQPMFTSKAKVLAKQMCSKKQISTRSSSCPLVGIQRPPVGTSWFSSILMLSMSNHAFHTWQATKIQLSKTTQMRLSLHNILATATPETRTDTSASGFPSSSSMSSSLYRAFRTCQSITSNVMKPAEFKCYCVMF